MGDWVEAGSLVAVQSEEMPRLEDILMVRDFSEVFLDDLPST